MKAIIMATAATLAVACIVTITFRWAPQARRAGLMVKVFLWSVPLLVFAWGTTPDDLGVLPRTMLAEPPWFDLAACLFFYASAFGGGLLQLYNLADRGLSLRILAELRAAEGRAMTVEEMVGRYSEGKGLGWMYDKRLEGLTRHRLVVIDDARVTLTPRGRLLAGRLAALRRFLRLPPV